MLVELTYGRAGNIYAAEKAAFNGGQLLMPWTDYRIPSRFVVSTFESTNAAPVAVLATISTGTVGDATTALKNIRRHVALTPEADFAVGGLPDEDYKQWRKIMIRGWVKAFVQGKVSQYAIRLSIEESNRLLATGKAKLSRQEMAAVEQAARTSLGFSAKKEPIANLAWAEPRNNALEAAADIKAKLNADPNHFHWLVAHYNLYNAVGTGAAADNAAIDDLQKALT